MNSNSPALDARDIARDPPGGTGRRRSPAGVLAGSPLTRIDGPEGALSLVAADLRAIEAALRDLVRSEVRAVPAVAGHLVDAGGKRLRPALGALASLALGVPVNPRLLAVGEMIHLGSLLHDDVVDEGTERRGRPAAHRVFGNAVTVLTGDFCLARAMLLASEEGGHSAVTELGRAVTEMAEGEVLQLQRAGDLDCGRTEYFEVVDKKSAALIAWCCAAPAFANGDSERIAALMSFGRAVGVAFQITDDVLDYRAGTGKAPGADLRQRKVTLPLLHAMDALPELRAELQAGEPVPERIGELIAQIRSHGALDAALRDAQHLVDRAVAALDPLPDGVGKQALAVLGRHLVERVS